MKHKMMKWKCLHTQEEYFSDIEPVEKTIDGQKFIEVTQNFKSSHFIRLDSVVKQHRITCDIKNGTHTILN